MVVSGHHTHEKALAALVKAAASIKKHNKTDRFSVQIHQQGMEYQIRLFERDLV
jgi:hypothetical protein